MPGICDERFDVDDEFETSSPHGTGPAGRSSPVAVCASPTEGSRARQRLLGVLQLSLDLQNNISTEPKSAPARVNSPSCSSPPLPFRSRVNSPSPPPPENSRINGRSPTPMQHRVNGFSSHHPEVISYPGSSPSLTSSMFTPICSSPPSTIGPSGLASRNGTRSPSPYDSRTLVPLFASNFRLDLDDNPAYSRSSSMGSDDFGRGEPVPPMHSHSNESRRPGRRISLRSENGGSPKTPSTRSSRCVSPEIATMGGSRRIAVPQSSAEETLTSSPSSSSLSSRSRLRQSLKNARRVEEMSYDEYEAMKETGEFFFMDASVMDPSSSGGNES
mmetsp:Transcript_639/g.1087  ORF Transcript_639/g.1087 Transcript_639/m.1087 type:complete len:330 (+) Transcript_639:93-1082(+)